MNKKNGKLLRSSLFAKDREIFTFYVLLTCFMGDSLRSLQMQRKKSSNWLLKAFLYVDVCKRLREFYDAVSIIENNYFSRSILIWFLNYQIRIRNREDPYFEESACVCQQNSIVLAS